MRGAEGESLRCSTSTGSSLVAHDILAALADPNVLAHIFAPQQYAHAHCQTPTVVPEVGFPHQRLEDRSSTQSNVCAVLCVLFSYVG
jgi:hypothetical protein